MTPPTRPATVNGTSPRAAVTVVNGTRRDAHAAADLIAASFQNLAVAQWLITDSDERQRALYGQFRIVVEHAFDYGSVYFAENGAENRAGNGTGERAGVAVWFRRDRPLPDIPDYDRRLWLATGPHLKRFQVLDAAFDEHHPVEPDHHHFAFLAVHPDHQGRGIGTALMDHYHARLDQAGMPAYLEASSQRNRDLYRRHGYREYGLPIVLPDGGPRMWPMWRTPATPPTTG